MQDAFPRAADFLALTQIMAAPPALRQHGRRERFPCRSGRG
jgi:hypothetical protein